MRSKLFFTLALLLGVGPALADDFRPSSNITVGSTPVAGAAGALYSDGATLRSFAATFTSTSGLNAAFANNESMFFTMDGSLSTPLVKWSNTNAGGGGSANFLEMWLGAGAQPQLAVYISSNTAFFSRTYAIWSGHFSGGSYSGGPGSTINAPSATQPTMIGCWADITGPCILARENQGMPGEQVFQGMTWDGRSTVAISAGFSEILFGNQTVGNGQFFLGDTFFGRGNAAALLQAGGPDNVTPVAQTFAASGAPAPVTAQAISGAAGTELVYLYALPSSAVLQSIQVGMTVTDTTNSVIPANTTVTATNIAGQTVTLSADITGSGVQFNDTLVFSTPNTAGSALTIAGGRGTGTGAGGVLNLGYSPAGSAGSAQNAWVDLLILSSKGVTFGGPDAAIPLAQTINTQNVLAGTTNTAAANLTINASVSTGTGACGDIIFQTASPGSSGSAQNTLTPTLTLDCATPVTIGKGGASTQQLAFTPNSGVAAAFGMASGGSELIAFSNGIQIVGFEGPGLVVLSAGGLSFSAANNQVTTTNYSGVWQCATVSGSFPCVTIGSGTPQDFSGTLKLASIQLAGGAVPTGTTGSCTASSFTGGATAGSFSAASCAAGTFILSALPAAPHGYTCAAFDETTTADAIVQTASTATSATFKATTAASDAIAYHCFGY
jgi:hypothetical protein